MADEKDEKKEGEDEKIEIGVKDYTLILDRLEELEEVNKRLLEGGGKGKNKEAIDNDEGDDIDRLLEEGKGKSRVRQVDYDNMTPSQLVNQMRQEFGASLADMGVAIHALRLEREIDSLIESGLTDLGDYEEEIFRIMTDNPKMSVKRAYTIAKAENPKAKKKDDDGDDDKGKRRSSFLDSLPDPRRKRSYGERPGAARSTTDRARSKTVEDAAERAFDETFKNDK